MRANFSGDQGVPTGRRSAAVASHCKVLWGRLRKSAFVQQVLLAPLEPMLHDSLFRIRIFVLLVLIFTPIYFSFWSWVDPQPVENWPLRLVSMVGCAPMLSQRFRTRLGARGMNWYWSLACWFTLPFFFFTMYRANGYNDVWMASCVAMLYCLYILTDWRLATLGSIIAVAASSFQPALGFQSPPLAHYAIFLFAFGTAILLSISDANLRFLRARAALATIGVMAHELRTPLASAGVLVESLRDGCMGSCSDARTRAKLDKLEAIFGGINTLIDYQIASTKLMNFPTTRQTLPLGDLVEGSLAGLPGISGSETDCITVMVTDPGKVSVHPEQMRHVVQNLVSNAVKSVNATGRAIQSGDVTLVVDGDPERVRLRVADRGVGVKPEDMNRLFEPFFSTSTMPSHGLGLTMCRNAITAFGGDIWCTSLPGQGATFHILLPRVH